MRISNCRVSPTAILLFSLILCLSSHLSVLHAAMGENLGGRDGTYDGVTFTDDEEIEALEIANDASRSQLQFPGTIEDPQRATILDGRPWSSLQDLSDAPGIETETMQDLLDYVQTEGYNAWSGCRHDLNNATIDELTEISGIGTVTATAIFNYRAGWNYYEEEDQLVAVGGMGISEIDGWRVADPGIFVSSFTQSGWEEPVHTYYGDYPRIPQILPITQVVENLESFENMVIRFERAAVTYIYNPETSYTFFIGDWKDESSFTPDSPLELKVYMKERNNTRILDPYDIWEVSDGEPYSRENFYRNWDPLSSGRIDTNFLFSIEGVLINDPVYGWELVVRPDWYAGEDRITLLEKWLEAEDWAEFHGYYNKPHIGAKIRPVYSGGWTVSIPVRLVNAHPCIDYAASQGESPPGGSPYYDYGEPKSEFVNWFEFWLEEWKNAPQIDHPLISEVYVDALDESDSEFIELYNPTDSPIDLAGWDIWDGGGVEVEIPAGSIAAHGHFLIADVGWSTDRDDLSWPLADVEDEMSLTNSDHGIALRDPSDTTLDAFGWGTPDPGEPYEGTPMTDPAGNGYSFERYPDKDTDDNSVDFFENPPEAVNPQSVFSECPVLFVDPVDIDFGPVTAGDTFDSLFTVTNVGNGVLKCTIAEEADWITSVFPDTFALGEGISEEVAFAGTFPSEAGEYEAFIAVSSNGGNDSVRVSCVVESGVPDVTIDVEILTPIVEKPGPLRVRLTAANHEDQNVTCDVFTRVKLPNGKWYPSGGWLFGPYSLTVPAQGSRSGVLTHFVPVPAPVGEYQYEGNIGLHPDVWHTDTGTFTVE